MRPPIVGLVRPAGHGEDSEQPPNDDDNNYDDHLLVASEAGDRVSPLMVSAGHSRPPSRSSSVDSGKGGRQRRRSHRQRTSSARSFMSGNGNAAVLKAAASSTVAAVPIRRGSGNPEFDREWSELHASVAMALTQLEGYIVQLEAHSRAETSETLTPALQRSAVTLVARLNIDIIRLARMTDEQLDVDLYDGSRMDLLGDGNGDVGDWLSWRLVEKKHREMRLTKAFKEVGGYCAASILFSYSEADITIHFRASLDCNSSNDKLATV